MERCKWLLSNKKHFLLDKTYYLLEVTNGTQDDMLQMVKLSKVESIFRKNNLSQISI